MHSNLWATLYLTLIPTVLFLLIAFILKLARRKAARIFLLIGLALLLFPILFVVSHFTTVNTEMKLRAGTYVVTQAENLENLCKGVTFDTLQLTLEKDGKFHFNYKPCFSDKASGRWDWHEDMVTTGTTFDRLNDSLYLNFINDSSDSIMLSKYQMSYLVFTKVLTGK